MKISKITDLIQPSHTRQLYNRAKEYSDVIDFTLGDPDFDTPSYVKNFAIQAIIRNKTKYSANAGLLELRHEIAANIKDDYKVEYSANDEIIVTVGAMEALYLSLMSILDANDEVIIPAPYWINYEQMTLMCGGVPVIVDSNPENGFALNIDGIRSVISDKTVAIIINSPNNPTGNVYDYDSISELYKLAVENNIVIIWDECYKTIVYDDEFVSVLDFPDAKEHIIYINSCSKKLAMTGYRLGYMAAPNEVISLATILQENIVACASLPSQYAALAAFDLDDRFTMEMKDGFEHRIDTFVTEVNKVKKLKCNKPQGTFYVLVDIRQTGINSEDFAYRLLESEHVAVVPGITYGKCCEGFIRIACTIDEDKIIEGTRRIRRFIDSL